MPTLTVWKYRLYPRRNTFEVPVGAAPLLVSADTGEPCLWMLLDPDVEEKENRTFLVVATGEKWGCSHRADETRKHYIGTFFTANVSSDGKFPPILVFHVFELERE